MSDPVPQPREEPAGSVPLVDSNVLLDVFTDDPRWADWSVAALVAARDAGRLVINALVYAEVSTGFATVEELDHTLPSADFEREALPFEAGFLAGKAVLAHRRRGGERRSLLADFYIGAHAAVRGYRLLTRDAARYRTYFPGLRLIAP